MYVQYGWAMVVRRIDIDDDAADGAWNVANSYGRTLYSPGEYRLSRL